MQRSNPGVGEGVLITLVGIIGIIRVLGSLPDAGPMTAIMLYSMFIIFIAIALIGIRFIIDALK